MNYWKFKITVAAASSEALLGLLSSLPFDTFEETAEGWNAYLPESEVLEDVLESLNRLRDTIHFTDEKEWIPAQNWNELWESNFDPILVGDFCGVRAQFHPSFQNVQYELLIQPKMAFGTGHHATTYMMIEQMKHLQLEGKTVLDFGAGTGILAILAAKMGAVQVDAVEIEPEACNNAEENVVLNATQQVEVLVGSLEQVAGKQYDIVLANINRNVILDSLSALHNRMKKGATLLISGILVDDGQRILNNAKKAGFIHLHTNKKSGWLCIALTC